MDNAQEIALVKVETSDIYSDKSMNYYAENLASAGSIDNINENYSVEFIENSNKRIIEGQKLEGLRISTEEISKDISYANYDKNLATSGSLAAVNDYASSIATQNALLPRENNLLITDVKLEAAKLDGGIQEVQRNRVLAVDQQLINLKTQNGIKDASRVEKQKENTLYLNQLDAKVTIVSAAINISDEEQRLQSQKGIDNSKIVSYQKNIDDQDQVKLLSLKMDNLTNSISYNESVAGSNQKEILLDAQNKLDNTFGARKEKVIVANTLGTEYPEGVSQEVFQSKDVNGILESIITRRIVVIQGKGDVYVKTQRLESITYSKNGSSTTEFIWQKETQPAGLERHY
jgi:hypothetical protein